MGDRSCRARSPKREIFRANASVAARVRLALAERREIVAESDIELIMRQPFTMTCTDGMLNDTRLASPLSSSAIAVSSGGVPSALATCASVWPSSAGAVA